MNENDRAPALGIPPNEDGAPMEADALAPALPPDATSIDDPPPFLGSWRNVYLVVLGELAALVILFYAVTRWVS